MKPTMAVTNAAAAPPTELATNFRRAALTPQCIGGKATRKDIRKEHKKRNNQPLKATGIADSRTAWDARSFDVKISGL